MSDWLWILLGLLITFRAVMTGKGGCGKLITYPMVKYILRKLVEKTHKKTDDKSLTMKDVNRTLFVFNHVVRTPMTFRMWQINILIAIWLPAVFAFNLSTHEPDPFWICYMALYLDDILTADSDNWRKKWKALKNKIKWRMVLPKTANQTS